MFEGLLKAVRHQTNSIERLRNISEIEITLSKNERAEQTEDEVFGGDNHDDVDPNLKNEVAEAIIAELEVDTKTIDDYDLGGNEEYLSIPDHLKDKSLMGLQALKLGVGNKGNDQMGMFMNVFLHAY